MQTVLSLFDEMNCGVVLFDHASSTLSLNICAGRILATHGFHKRHAKATSLDAMGHAMRGLFGPDFACSAEAIVTVMGAHGRPLIACKKPHDVDGGRRTIVILVDLGERPRPSIQTLRQAFGLTGAEAQIAARLAFGESLRRIADDHKVSIVTTRAQLKAVFAKTGTHRQAELVALVNRLAPLP